MYAASASTSSLKNGNQETKYCRGRKLAVIRRKMVIVHVGLVVVYIIIKKCARNDLCFLLSGFLCGVLGRWWNRLVLLAHTNSLFYPLYLFGVYTAIGPWFIGEMTRGHIGALFVHGMYLKHHWIPGSLSYYYGIMQLVLFNLPLTLYLAYFVEIYNRPVIKETSTKSPRPDLLGNLITYLKKCLAHFVFVTLVLWQASSSYNLMFTYGKMSFLLSPGKTWSVVLALYLFWKVHSPRGK